MSKFFFLLVISLSLISCGNAETKKLQQFAAARGPIKSACMNSGRDKATTQLCGCAQVAASQALTYEDQQRGAAFFFRSIIGAKSACIRHIT